MLKYFIAEHFEIVRKMLEKEEKIWNFFPVYFYFLPPKTCLRYVEISLLSVKHQVFESIADSFAFIREEKFISDKKRFRVCSKMYFVSFVK